jgi:hypothetical protein
MTAKACELCNSSSRLSTGHLCADCIATGQSLLDVWRNLLQARILCAYVRECRRLPAAAITAAAHEQALAVGQSSKGDGIWHI